MATRYVRMDEMGRLFVRCDGYIAYAPMNTKVDRDQKVWVNHPAGQYIHVRLEPRGKYVELWETAGSYLKGL